jgi:Tfp pilus assembly protein PilX
MQKGFALITVLAVLIMIALGTATVLQSIGSQASMKSLNLQELKDQYLAEAGMQYALWVCRKNNGNCSSLNVTAPSVTLPKGTTGLEQDINIKTDPTSGTGPYKIKVCAGAEALDCAV